MYRYSADNVVTFSSDDLVLFRESPFASWMERLTLENPSHGIPPDVDVEVPTYPYRPQNVFAATLRSSGRQSVQIDWDLDERQRRSATLEAMRIGAEFIVDGQLAVGSLAGPVNLLTRTSGFSELGRYLYMPCDTQGDRSIHATFRLCFLADMLHSLQGQLPPQMLAIRGNTQLSPLRTEEFIHLYCAVKDRFLTAQRHFREDCMPDPAESSHCGRWNDCANEVIRQRNLARETGHNNRVREPKPDTAVEPTTRAPEPPEAVGDTHSHTSSYDLDSIPARSFSRQGAGTLAQQALQLPIQGKASSGFVERRGEVVSAHLEPLNFIADFSQSAPQLSGLESAPDRSSSDELLAGNAVTDEAESSGEGAHAARQYAWTVESTEETPLSAGGLPHPLDSPGFNISAHSRVYKRSPAVSPAAATLDAATYDLDDAVTPEQEGGQSSFSNQLNTSEPFDT